MQEYDSGAPQRGVEVTKRSEQPTPGHMGSTEIEVQFLLKEYEVLRAEMLAKQGFQVQFSNLAILLLGALVAVVPIVIFAGANGLPVSIPLSYIVTGLLIVALIFLSLLWAVMDEDIEVAIHGNYYNNEIRARVGAILGTSDANTPVLNWDRYRMKVIVPHTPLRFLYSIGFVARGTARYGIYVIPAGITMVVSVILYFESSSFPPVTIVDWVNVSLFAFDVLYSGSSIPFLGYISRLYRSIRASADNVPIG